MRRWCICLVVVMLGACEKADDRQAVPGNEAGAVANEVGPRVPAPATGPDARTPLAPVKPAIDPKSVEAAGQVVQHYAALIEQGRWTASRELWSSADAAKAFELNFRTYADVHVEIGDLGEAEGAAGSIYVTEPVTFHGKKNGGGEYRRAAKVLLRRVNDVPGSTESQRRWHIERIDWGAAG